MQDHETTKQPKKKRVRTEAQKAARRINEKAYRQTETHRQYQAAWQKAWRLANPEKARAIQAAHYAANPEKARAKASAWAKANRDKCNAAKKRQYAANGKKIRAVKNAWNAAHPEKARARALAWYYANKERVKAHVRNRKARIRSSDGHHTAEDIQKIWDRQKHKCAVKNCTHPIASSGKHKYHVDHIKPVIRGGSNDPFNLQLLCAPCNLKKHDKDEYEWAQEHGMLFPK